MTALVAASLSTKEFGPAPTMISGLALTDQSYWRQTSSLGRVIGGVKDVKRLQAGLGHALLPKIEALKDG
jgi:hypothetical protein